jgi:hypothetical protein
MRNLEYGGHGHRASRIWRGAITIIWLIQVFQIAACAGAFAKDDLSDCQALNAIFKNPKILNSSKGAAYSEEGIKGPTWLLTRGLFGFEVCKLSQPIQEWDLWLSCVTSITIGSTAQQRNTLYRGEEAKLQACMRQLEWIQDKDAGCSAPSCIAFLDTSDPAAEKNSVTLKLEEEIELDSNGTRHSLVFEFNSAPEYKGKRR